MKSVNSTSAKNWGFQEYRLSISVHWITKEFIVSSNQETLIFHCTNVLYVSARKVNFVLIHQLQRASMKTSTILQHSFDKPVCKLDLFSKVIFGLLLLCPLLYIFLNTSFYFYNCISLQVCSLVQGARLGPAARRLAFIHAGLLP